MYNHHPYYEVLIVKARALCESQDEFDKLLNELKNNQNLSFTCALESFIELKQMNISDIGLIGKVDAHMLSSIIYTGKHTQIKPVRIICILQNIRYFLHSVLYSLEGLILRSGNMNEILKSFLNRK